MVLCKPKAQMAWFLLSHYLPHVLDHAINARTLTKASCVPRGFSFITSVRGGCGDDKEIKIRRQANILSQDDSVDIEDSPLDIIRRRGRSNLHVTELTSQHWCEQQLDYVLRSELGRQEVTKEMQAGVDRHQEVELQVHDISEVAVQSREDASGVRILNLMTSAIQLCTQGIAREIPVFGELGGLRVSGIIDELRLDQEGRVRLCELKTRGSPTLPAAAQQRGTKLQLSAYKALWDALVAGQTDLATWAAHSDPDAPFSEPFQKDLLRFGTQASTLRSLSRACEEALGFCQVAHPTFEVTYEHKGTRIGTVTLEYDDVWFRRTLDEMRPFWKGHSAPKSVPSSEGSPE